MASATSHKTYSYTSSAYRTPKVKEIIPASSSFDRSKDESHSSIVMDEYGQTPDHYYLAKKTPSFYQVKRRLDLQVNEAAQIERSQSNEKKTRKNGNSVKPEKSDKPRYDTSLGQLTKKFLKLLAEATDGVINLNAACAMLDVPKRRLYDITNVLEGAGLVTKKSRNNIQWMGKNATPGVCRSKSEIEKELDMLEAKENKLDELIFSLTEEMEIYKKTNKQYQYITGEDLKEVEEFSNKQLLGVSVSPSQSVDHTEDGISVSIASNKNSEIQACLLSDVASLNIYEEYDTSLDNYCMNIENNINVSEALKSPKVSPEKIPSPVVLDPNEPGSPEVASDFVWANSLESDSAIRNAFITEEDDIGPIGKHFFLQTEDQNIDDLLPFPILENPVDAYSFSLDNGEGLTDLYDCGFQEIAGGL